MDLLTIYYYTSVPLLTCNLIFYSLTTLSTSITSSQNVVRFISEHKDCDSIIFKNELDKNYNCVHSDIKESKLHNAFVYDITKYPENKHINKYDFVLNISTMEEIKSATDSACVRSSLPLMKALCVNSPGFANRAPYLMHVLMICCCI